MKTDKIALTLGKEVDRRRMFKRAGAVAVGATFAVLGLSDPAMASPACCNLCQPPSSCSGGCRWCWACCYGRAQYQCCEVYNTGSTCSRCNQLRCSTYRRLSSPCTARQMQASTTS